MISDNGNRDFTLIEITGKDGKRKWQWQDNFIWQYLQRKTKRDIRIPILTGYPTKIYKIIIKK